MLTINKEQIFDGAAKPLLIGKQKNNPIDFKR